MDSPRPRPSRRHADGPVRPKSRRHFALFARARRRAWERGLAAGAAEAALAVGEPFLARPDSVLFSAQTARFTLLLGARRHKLPCSEFLTLPKKKITRFDL